MSRNKTQQTVAQQTETGAVSQIEVQEEVTMNTTAQPALTLNEKLAARIAAAKAQALVEMAVAEAAKAAKLATPKPTKADPEYTLCECGCGVFTGGGKYRPGHDAKHKSALFVLAKAGDEDALNTLDSKGWLKLMAAPKAPTEAKISRKAYLAKLDEDAIENAERLAECGAMVQLV